MDVSNFTLKTIQFLSLGKTSKAHLYYSRDLDERMDIIYKHLSLIAKVLDANRDSSSC